jgi:hypothetical protein
MNQVVRLPFLLTAVVLVSGCGAQPSPELVCQQRIVGVADRPGPQTAAQTDGDADPFQHEAYAALDRSGCTAKQLAALDRIMVLARTLPVLTEANNRIGESGNDTAHMEAFQKMNNAVIELNDLQQGAKADLEAMVASQP